MRRRASRPWIFVIAGGAVVFTGLAIGATVAALRGGCSLPAPQTELPASLRAVGDFGQAYPAGDDRGLEEAAAAIAATLDRNLLGTIAASPVREQAPDAFHYAAAVIPLSQVLRGSDGPRVVGTVVFLDDCDGRHYYSTLHDFSGRDPATLARSFPGVSQQEAASRLAGGTPVLTYANDPNQPVWRNPATGQTLPAS